jgi:hypothetical protein
MKHMKSKRPILILFLLHAHAFYGMAQLPLCATVKQELPKQGTDEIDESEERSWFFCDSCINFQIGCFFSPLLGLIVSKHEEIKKSD